MGDLSEPQVVFEEMYEPRDALGAATRAATTTGAAGLFLAAVQNTVAKENIGPFGVFSRYGTTIATFAAMGGAYQFVSTASANLREQNDWWNHSLGGFCSGAIVGLTKRSMPAVLGNGFALGAVLGIVSYTGGNVFGAPSNDLDDDPGMRKEELRKRFRRPINETINEIGEGRGIYGPGYDERRKQRIKEKYGFEIQEPYYKGEPAEGA